MTRPASPPPHDDDQQSIGPQAPSSAAPSIAAPSVAAPKPNPDAQPAPRKARQLSLATIAAAGSVLTGLLICLIVSALLVLHARNAVREETASAYLMATATATFRLPTSFGRNDVMAQALQLADEIDSQRHVSAWIEDAAGKRLESGVRPQPAPPTAPEWLSRLLTPPQRSDLFPIRHYPNVLGIMMVATDPSDEIAKTWATLREILPLLWLAIAVMIAVTMSVTLFVTRRLSLLEGAVARMRANDLSVRAPASALRELGQLSEGVNALASHLEEGRAENRMLQERMLSLAESERARIAHDLHDDMGPQLFALRAAVGQAETALRGPSSAPDTASAANPILTDALSAIARHAQAVQKSARNAIEDLRPMTLDDASLDELLHELVLNFSDIAPDVAISLDTDPRAESSEAAEIAIYRFVRETVLNAIRHANPARIAIEMSVKMDAGPAIVTSVRDNGTGLSAQARAGLGQRGIADRARILQADYMPPTRRDGWTVTELRMPLS